MNRSLRLLWIAAAALALGACSGYSPESLSPGTPVAEVRSAMGTPTNEYPGPNGTRRLEYAKGPYGLHTFMVDIDAQGRMTGSQQVLTRATFDTIRVGMSRDEVLYRIGRPAETSSLPYQNRQLWSYRYDGTFCEWFQVSLNPRGEVVDTGYSPDPICTSEDQ